MNVKAAPAITITDSDTGDILFQRAAAAVEQNYTVDEESSGTSVLSPSATPVTLSLGTLTNVVGCFVESTQACTLTLNGHPIALTPIALGQKARFYYDGLVSSLTVLYNPAGTDTAKVAYAVWGN